MNKLNHLLVVIVLLAIGVMMSIAVLEMPEFADPDAPIHRHVAPRYMAMSYQETGVPNMVTAILADYRGYDTLGELTVIFAGGVAVLSILGGKRKK
ncbi:MAG: hypothetical protein DDT40_00878 [candidate division WS2 bacterium]|nr:hypothetical protein [Candidatus Psychracetigena formicireducens]MBT9138276.1 hypothetical protein [Bacillota bacterium]MBT9150701.1 hypothetical protein [Candidatus Psychracetigena formicireducens]